MPIKKLGRYDDEAIELHEKTLELRKVVLGEYHPYTMASVSNLAFAYSDAGRYDEAIELSQAALEQARKKPSKSGQLASALARLALILVEHQKFQEAEPHARECLNIREKIMTDHWLRYNAMSLLGGALGGQGKHEEAEPLLLAGYRGLHQRRDKIPGAARIRLTEALQRIVQLYETWDKPDQAAEWKQRLAQLETDEPANGESSDVEKK